MTQEYEWTPQVIIQAADPVEAYGLAMHEARTALEHTRALLDRLGS